MKKSLVFLVALGLTFGAWAQGADSKAAVKAINGLSVDLYKKLGSQNQGNLFFSPYSISDALAMAYGGARGATEQEMAKTLYFPLEQEKLHESFSDLNAGLKIIQQKGNIEINVANSLWVQSDYQEGADYFKVKEEFLNLTLQYYKSQLNKVDYRDITKAQFIRETINAWVEKNTNNKIKNLVPPDVPDRNTRLILVNAIYFKGKWQDAFKKNDTKPMSFYLNANETKNVDMMHQTGNFKYSTDDLCHILELPYKGGDLSMVIILPREKDGLINLERQLTLEKINSWLPGWRPREVEVYLPKFKLEAAFMLADTLKEMGMPAAFDQKSADFSGMADFPAAYQLYISKVIHKAFVDVYEEGTEAGAATGMFMDAGGRSLPEIFRADHPFIFLIKDNKTGAILFLGRYVKPE